MIKKEIHKADVEMLLYKYKIQPVYCCCPFFKQRRIYTWAIKLKSKIKSKGFVKLKNIKSWK